MMKETKEKRMKQIRVDSDISIEIKVGEILKNVPEEVLTEEFIGKFQKQMMDGIIDALDLDVDDSEFHNKTIYEIETISTLRKGDNVILSRSDRVDNK